MTIRKSRPYLASVSAISVIISFRSERLFAQRLQMISSNSLKSCSQSGHTSGKSCPDPDPESLDFDNDGARRISTLALLDLEVSLPTPESVRSMSITEEFNLCLKIPSSLSTLESLT